MPTMTSWCASSAFPATAASATSRCCAAAPAPTWSCSNTKAKRPARSNATPKPVAFTWPSRCRMPTPRPPAPYGGGPRAGPRLGLPKGAWGPFPRTREHGERAAGLRGHQRHEDVVAARGGTRVMHQEIVFADKGRIALQALEAAAPLQPGEVRGSTLCSLISPGTELAWAAEGPFPVRPGYAAVFRAEEFGSDVTGIAPGTLLLCMGPHRSVQQVEGRHTVTVPGRPAPQNALPGGLV